MIRIRRGTAISVREVRTGLLRVEVDLGGPHAEQAVAYPDLCGQILPGDRLILNTTAVALGLGTGGLHFVIAVEGKETGADEDLRNGQEMKLRYTPLQTTVRAAETSQTLTRLDGVPVVIAGLHSALEPAAIGIAAERPGTRVVYVMTDAAALPIAFSDTVAQLRADGLIHATVTSGHAFGGDAEAVSIFGALPAAVALGAQILIVAMGPGHLGSSSTLGFTGMEVGVVVNAVSALGGIPIVAPRIGFADPRPRHTGLSHHTLTALGVAALSPAIVALPTLDDDCKALIAEAVSELRKQHDVVDVDLGSAEEALRDRAGRLSTMGRGFESEPHYFRAAAAAGVLAARQLKTD